MLLKFQRGNTFFKQLSGYSVDHLYVFIALAVTEIFPNFYFCGKMFLAIWETKLMKSCSYFIRKHS